MEAIILAGGKAERLGDAAGGRPKSLVEIAGKPLAAYQVGRLARAGVERVIVSCAAGQGALFEQELAGPRRGDRRGGGARAARPRRRDQVRGARRLRGRRRLRAERRRARRRRFRARCSQRTARRRARDDHRRAAEVAVRRSSTSTTATSSAAFARTRAFPYWVNCGNYVLSAEAIERFPDRGDHESTTFPELAAEGRLHAYRHEASG